MEIYVKKTQEPGCGFKYIDYISFGSHDVSPLSSEFDEKELKQEIEIDGGSEEDVSDVPLSVLFSEHISHAQFCGPDGEEIYAEGGDVYRYIGRTIGMYDGNGKYYEYTDSPDGPIVADTTDRTEDAVLPEFLGQVIDMYEEFLVGKGIYIQNKDRDREWIEAADALCDIGPVDTGSPEKGAEDMGLARIYGSDYDYIADSYREATGCWDSELPPAVSRETGKAYAEMMTQRFMDIIAERGFTEDGSLAVTSEERDALTGRTLETIERWGLCGIDPEACLEEGRDDIGR